MEFLSALYVLEEVSGHRSDSCRIFGSFSRDEFEHLQDDENDLQRFVRAHFFT